MSSIGENTQFASTQNEGDRLNAIFYNQIKYPWAPAAFEKLTRINFWRKMISQDLGYWNEYVIPKNANIWVAGCGTNQAIFTALKFPDAKIIGSDLSKESLSICEKNSKQLKINNLELRNESINESTYHEHFDYIVCTGVIHHNSDPQTALTKLANAIKCSGLMEIMVYNKFHRINTAAFQLAVRLLTGSTSNPDFEKELPLAKKIVGKFSKNCSMLNLMNESKEIAPAAFADALLQPIEYSYTIETLDELANNCGLQLLHFCVDQFSKARQTVDWNLEFGDTDLDSLYSSLPDTKRWQVTNLLLGEMSPKLWFYMQRKDSVYTRKTEQQLCNEFLDTQFKKVNIEKEIYIINPDNTYNNIPVKRPVKIDKNLPCSEAKKIYDELDSSKPIKETIHKLGISTSFLSINKIRTYLTTSGFPYLEAVP